MRKAIMRKAILILCVILIILSLAACSKTSEEAESVQEDNVDEQQNQAREPEPTPTPEPPRKITIVAVGDIMFHQPQIKAASTKDGYNFMPSFEDIKVVIESADIAIGNLETTINPDRKPSGYPMFNAPPEALDALKLTGFDILVTANNHSVDTGEKGIRSTVEQVRKRGMLPVGTGEKHMDKHAVLESNGIKIGVLAYTSSTNGLSAPEGMINMEDLDQIISDIEKVKPQCDFLIVYVHTGSEYVRAVEAKQKELFRAIADAGADCVIGSHPHVVRPSELYKTDGREVLINYSLGNFISNQNDKYTDIGGMLQFSIVKHEGQTRLDMFEMLPVYRLRYKDGDNTIRKVVLCSNIDAYEMINEKSKEYIQNVSIEISKLLEAE